jgi:hypothetical protein
MKKEHDEETAYNQKNSLVIHFDKHTDKVEYNSIQKQELFSWMAKASENTLCEVMKAINPAPYKKLMGPDKARLHALLVAADRVRSTLERTGRKNPDRDLARMDETHDLHLSMITPPKTRRSPKREKIALHEGIIRQLFAKGYSLRQSCVYLKRHAGLDVNHSYLRQCCLEMGIAMSEKKKPVRMTDEENAR